MPYNLWPILNTIVYKKTYEWYIEWQRMTTSDNKWYNEWRRMKTSDNEWQRVVQQVTKSDKG